MTVPQPEPHPLVLFFLPAFNEAEAIGAVLDRIPANVAGHRIATLVIDDGSRDATAAIARTHGVDVLSLPENRGLGAAVRVGLAHTSILGAAAVVFCDADQEYDPAEVERLVGPVLDGTADYVVGSRFAGRERRMRPHRYLGNRALTLVVRRLSGLPITDGQSGYRALSAAAANDAEVIHDFNYAQVLTLDLVSKGYRYREVPITYRFRTTGRSFVRLVPYLRAVIPALRRQRRVIGARQSSTTKDRKSALAASQAP